MQRSRIDSFSGEYAWLSNFYECEVRLDGELYFSVEHAYVAAKTRDLKTRAHIRTLRTAGAAKSFGRSIQLRDNWDKHRIPVMFDLLRQKFQDPELKQKLLDTGDAELVEGNHWGDTFWGVCNGVGRNHLGSLLMSIRAASRTTKLF